MAHDLPYRSRLVTCDLCGRLGTRMDIRPGIVPVGREYESVMRCRDRRSCETEVDRTVRRELSESMAR